jgi:hypothetical protein
LGKKNFEIACATETLPQARTRPESIRYRLVDPTSAVTQHGGRVVIADDQLFAHSKLKPELAKLLARGLNESSGVPRRRGALTAAGLLTTRAQNWFVPNNAGFAPG